MIEFKKKLFALIRPISHLYPLMTILAIVQALITVALPIIYPMMETAYWLLSFTACAFWMSNYVLLKQAHLSREPEKGFRARMRQAWENILFGIWLLTSILFIYWLLKLGLFLIQLDK